jgi:hypothetical protein
MISKETFLIIAGYSVLGVGMLIAFYMGKAGS